MLVAHLYAIAGNIPAPDKLLRVNVLKFTDQTRNFFVCLVTDLIEGNFNTRSISATCKTACAENSDMRVAWNGCYFIIQNSTPRLT